jgi:hypothetical protein
MPGRHASNDFQAASKAAGYFRTTHVNDNATQNICAVSPFLFDHIVGCDKKLRGHG